MLFYPSNFKEDILCTRWNSAIHMLDVDDSIVRENTDPCYYALSYTITQDQHTSI